jgi:hypothetical protein
MFLLVCLAFWSVCGCAGHFCRRGSLLLAAGHGILYVSRPFKSIQNKNEENEMNRSGSNFTGLQTTVNHFSVHTNGNSGRRSTANLC